MRILVVDDDPLAGEMTLAILEELGHLAVYVESGIEAAGLLGQEEQFDLILSDLNMPMVNGIELFRELRSQGVMIPFVLLTGDDPESPLSEEPRLDGCLLKDFSLEETIPAAIEDAIARHNGG